MNIIFLKDIIAAEDVGGKGFNLAKMIQNNFNVPDGFVIKYSAFKNHINKDIEELVNKCDADDEDNLRATSNQIINILKTYTISDEIKKEIIDSYKQLNCKFVAVRSSAISEDGKSYAWAGQLETFLNIDENNLIESVIKCWESNFSPRALFYRVKNRFTSDLSMAVIVQKMIQSDASGVAFSINPTTNDKNEICIEAVLGLGESIVSGKVTPDTYIIDKDIYSIKSKDIRNQTTKLIMINNQNNWTTNHECNIQKIDDNQILALSKIIKDIENLYKYPVDVEWAIENGIIYILQCRPITTYKDNEIVSTIQNAGNWIFYVSRKFNWFVENTEISSTLKSYQQEIYGFDLSTQNYLCLNGDEYSLESDFDLFCKKLDNYFEQDVSFFEKFAKIEIDIVDEIKEAITTLENNNYKNANYSQLLRYFKLFNDIYIKSFIAGMTRPDDYLEYKLKKELANLNYSDAEIDKIFSKVATCPNYYPLAYSEEPLDLLRIAKKYKNNERIDELIDEHIKKYSWIKGPLEMENMVYDKDDYIQRILNLVEDNIDEKIDNIINVRKNIEQDYINILEQYNFNIRIVKLIKAIRDFIFLRTYTTEFSDHLFFVGRTTILKEISNRINIQLSDLIMLEDKEIVDILNNNGKISDTIIDTLNQRKIGFAIIWLNGNVQTLFGNESILVQEEISKKFKTSSSNEINTNTMILGNIANKGKVQGIAKVLNNYNDIYKVNRGDILIASMTTPDLISAMEKASGFITDEGGITCHAAILSREFDVPCIVGTVDATKKIHDGDLLELDAYNGRINILKKV